MFRYGKAGSQNREEGGVSRWIACLLDVCDPGPSEASTRVLQECGDVDDQAPDDDHHDGDDDAGPGDLPRLVGRRDPAGLLRVAQADQVGIQGCDAEAKNETVTECEHQSAGSVCSIAAHRFRNRFTCLLDSAVMRADGVGDGGAERQQAANGGNDLERQRSEGTLLSGHDNS